VEAAEVNPEQPSKELSNKPKDGLFPIVGIGASAGGLEALEQFLSNVSADSGMAYVVVQHLDPTHKGMLPELLQRITKLEVLQVKDNMVVNPNKVYVIPPNKTMTLSQGMLHLFEPTKERGQRLPIDYFLESLAEDHKEHSIGIILSGMGNDGSAGARALKENNGIVMVQDPENARFDSMPRSAINSVTVDIVSPANELPARLFEFLRRIPSLVSDKDLEIKDKSSLEKIINLLRTYTGNDFSLYKKNTIYRRIERRMNIHKVDGISQYVTFLNDNPTEIEILFKELLIGVTNFFRDEEVWTILKETILPDLISQLEPGSILRAWVPGCSTGEEAYSLAILFKEVVDKINPHGGFTLQIFATDLDKEAIEIARKGIFPSGIAADMSPERLKRYFLRTDDGYFIKTEIREKVVFAQHNIIMHPPFTKIDILTCRNLLIYMDPELQKKMIGLFYYSMNPGGVMVLGLSETLGAQSHLFESLDTKWKIFRRSNVNSAPVLYGFPATLAKASSKNEVKLPLSLPQNIQTVADKMLLQTYLPAGVLVNENGDILYISGHTGKYLEPAVGKANMNIFAMLREGFRKEFPVAFRKAVMNKESVNLNNLKVGTNGSSVFFNLSIHWINDAGLLNGMLFIIFAEIHDLSENDLPELLERKNLNQIRKRELAKELRSAYAKNHDALEAMRNSQEQYKSTNEELQAANEELQSANEELVSSKEEMQSLNEELQTLNAELLSKIEEFTHVNNDMKNLLESTDIATLFLDKELKIRRFTFQTVKIFKLIKSDIGRPFTDLDSDLVYPEITADVMNVLKTLTFIKKQIPTRNGLWYSVRIMPYRTHDDRINGVVITFFNISDLKNVEFKLYETEQMNNLLMKASSEIIIKLSADFKILEINPAAEKYFGNKQANVLSKNYVQTFVPEPLRKRTEKEMKKIMKNSLENNIKMMLITAEGQIEADILALILLNNVKVPSGMILSIKK